MKPRKIYNEVEATKVIEKEVLEPGGYVCKIMDTEVIETQWGERLVISFDIAEGKSAGHYQRRYENRFDENEKWKGNYRISVPADDGSKDDARVASRFKKFMQEVEDSNPGFRWDWDEKKLKGKLIGILFSDKEWEMNGNSGFFANPRYTTTVSEIREGKFKVPNTQYIDRSSSQVSNPVKQGNTDFMAIPDNAGDEGMPF